MSTSNVSVYIYVYIYVYLYDSMYVDINVYV